MSGKCVSDTRSLPGGASLATITGDRPDTGVSAPRLLKGGSSFHRELRTAVNESLDSRVRRNGRIRFFSKAAFMFLWCVASYVYLMFFSPNWMTMIVGCVSLAFAMGGIAFSIQHDANHGAIGRRWRFLGFSMDSMLGGSSYLWREKHNHAHHTYTNIVDKDGDIDQLPLARFAPDQKWRPWHKYQHVYMFCLYGFYAPKQIITGDALTLYLAHRAHVPIDRPRGRDLFTLIAGKVIFICLALVVPIMFHPVWVVLLAGLGALWILGIILAVVFQLAHCVEEAEFTSLEKLTNEVEQDGPRDWAEHQVETTVDFAQKSRLLAWYLGGLNFQVEHHLFPTVSHVHYRRISPIVEDMCAQHGLPYNNNATLMDALRSHSRWLKRMGERPPVTA